MATESPANGVSTTLSASITNSATTCSLTSATGFTNAQYHCLISDGTNNEIVTATALSGTTLTIIRASETWNGSATAYAFSSGAKITIVATVQSVQNLINQATIISGVTVSGTPATGEVLTATSSTAADWAAPSASLNYASGYNPTLVSLPGSTGALTDVFSTSSLAVGTWKITGRIVLTPNSPTPTTAVCFPSAALALGTAVGDFADSGSTTGPTNLTTCSIGTKNSSAGDIPPIIFDAIVVITTAGTLKFQANAGGTAQTMYALNNSPCGCQYTAVKIA